MPRTEGSALPARRTYEGNMKDENEHSDACMHACNLCTGLQSYKADQQRYARMSLCIIYIQTGTVCQCTKGRGGGSTSAGPRHRVGVMWHTVCAGSRARAAAQPSVAALPCT
jgi:hypothetical protein